MVYDYKATMDRRLHSPVPFTSRFVFFSYGAIFGMMKLTINLQQVGHAILHIDEFNEDYLITLPALHIDGLLVGSPYVELDGSTSIVSSSGYTAKISYSGKGWLSGSKNSYTASLHPTGKEREVLYTSEGRWSKGIEIKDAKTKKVVETHDPNKNKPTPLTVAPLDQQDEMESRRAWQKVAAAIDKGDMEATAREKTVIEERQRALRRQEKEENKEWARRFFKRAEEYPVFEALAAKIGEAVQADKTNGVWMYDSEKSKEAEPSSREL